MTSTSLLIRNASPILFAFAGLSLIGGCATVQDGVDATGRQYDALMAPPRAVINKYIRPTQTRLDPVMADPPADAASMARGWEPVAYIYPSGGVVAGPTYQLNYEDRPKALSNDYVYALMAPFLIISEAAVMPLWMVIEPPLTRDVYPGARYAPSMTLAPPLPEAVPLRSANSPSQNPGSDAPVPVTPGSVDSTAPAPSQPIPPAQP